ncbi:MAG: hypothetical protein WC755_00540 [Candidatus Woesearchaeota archaeon]|jgi:hypothetical protein
MEKRDLVSRINAIQNTNSKGLILAKKREEDIKNFNSTEGDTDIETLYGRYKTSHDADNIQKSRALVASKNGVMAIHQKDSLELQREAAGLVNARQDLITKISEQISFEKGMQIVLEHIKNKTGKEISTLKEISETYPDITSEEIAWISTIGRVPTVYDLSFLGGVPTIMDIDIEGIEFGFDGYNHYDMQRVTQKDAYRNSGFTGVNEKSKHYKFTSNFAKAFEALSLLHISDSYVFRQIYTKNKFHAFSRGDGILKRAILEANYQEFGIDLVKLKELPLTQLCGIDTKKLDKKIHNIIKNKVVHNLSLNENYSAIELVTLIGILSKIPDFILDKKPFMGYILPFGKGVKILDATGKELEHVSYHPLVSQLAQESLHYETKDISKSNHLTKLVFDFYTNEIASRFEHKHDKELPIEILVERFKKEYNITIEPKSIKKLNSEKMSPMLIAFGGLQGDEDFFEYSLKLGNLELKLLLDSFDLLPKKIMPKIKKIVREFSNAQSPKLLLGGIESLGNYNSYTQTITLLSTEDKTLLMFNEIELHLYKHTLMHEIGHSVLDSLTKKQRAEWKKISRADKSDTDAFMIDIELMKKIYRTDYEKLKEMDDIGDINDPMSASVLIQEDFAEHFAIYVNHGDEFRNSTNKKINAKYNFIKKIFQARAKKGEKIEYCQKPIFSLDEMSKYKAKSLKDINVEEALLLQRKKEQKREEEAYQSRTWLTQSFEQMTMSKQERKERKMQNYGNNKEHRVILQTIEEYLPQDINLKKINPDDFQDLIETSQESAIKYLIRKYSFIEEHEAEEIITQIKGQIQYLREKEKKKPEL